MSISMWIIGFLAGGAIGTIIVASVVAIMNQWDER